MICRVGLESLFFQVPQDDSEPGWLPLEVNEVHRHISVTTFGDWAPQVLPFVAHSWIQTFMTTALSSFFCSPQCFQIRTAESFLMNQQLVQLYWIFLLQRKGKCPLHGTSQNLYRWVPHYFVRIDRRSYHFFAKISNLHKSFSYIVIRWALKSRYYSLNVFWTF